MFYFMYTALLLVPLVKPTFSTGVFHSPGMFFNALHREKRYVTYPTGTAIGLYVAIALPVDVPEENLYFSLNFEANYNLPDNITQYYNSDIARVFHSITRRSTYDLVQDHLTRQGYDGKECLLLMICEISKHEIANRNLIDDIIHVIMRPSSTRNESLPENYYRAEKLGFDGYNCFEEYPKCDSNILDFISLLQ
ncbi:uncharacterized protein LOC135831558 [Planococcus citri]|uniref:uncharacterized protein LOC135831558 n=1 Tax=Planococcus citri TaxID=170843 RepID=UPI0031FA24D6